MFGSVGSRVWVKIDQRGFQRDSRGCKIFYRIWEFRKEKIHLGRQNRYTYEIKENK